MSHSNPPEDAAGGQPHETDGVRRRRTFSFADKKRICEAAIANPWLNYARLANHLGIDKYVVRRTLLESEQWLSPDAASRPDKARRKRPPYEPIEADLASWLRGQLDSGRQVELVAIRAEALRLAAAWNASNGTQDGSMRHFKCSQKWILHFKARHGFKNEYTIGPALRVPIRATGTTETEDPDDDSESSDDDDDDEAYNQHRTPKRGRGVYAGARPQSSSESR
ncbi:hypothetical protein FOMPIDRAFT_117648 [Fomitopsis schrenkii]|uniref:HTH CENPB-type domain-containing protein n=1 Tax=Fomitopsis schrenkii TaxID=2126942 RepID=S8DRK9_FOMSC|nr:hypothetical protein FOMPIDRAFT_117648 [Fomitopsis schrenkii]